MQVAQSLFNNIQGAGWNVRMSLRKADRIMLAFENGNRLAVISLYSQTVYSCVAEIWVSEKMADGSSLNLLPLRGEVGQNSGGFGGGFESNGPATGGGFETPDGGSTPPPVGNSGGWGSSSGGSSGSGLQERLL